MSVKFQVTLPEPLLTRLKRVAKAEKVSVAELIRQAMMDRLRLQSRRSKSDPFDAITNLVESDEVDLASQVDDILYR